MMKAEVYIITLCVCTYLCTYIHIIHYLCVYVWLLIIASHQTFSSQIKHMFGQIKFGQTNFLNISNGNFMEYAKENEYPDNFQSLS